MFDHCKGRGQKKSSRLTYHGIRLISRSIAHCTAASTFSASWVGLWAGGPSARSYTPVRTSTDDQPAAFAPAMSAEGDEGWHEVRYIGQHEC
jgi:hypothetical protein